MHGDYYIIYKLLTRVMRISTTVSTVYSIYRYMSICVRAASNNAGLQYRYIYRYIFTTMHVYRYEKTSSVRNNSEFPPGTVIGLMKVNRRQ